MSGLPEIDRRTDVLSQSAIRFVNIVGTAIYGLIVVVTLSGCSITALHDRTVDIGRSVGDIYTSQVLENLYRIAYDRNAMPSHFGITKGTIKTQETVTPTLTVPLGSQVTRTVVAGGVTQIVGNYNSFSLQGAEEWDQTWEIKPQEPSSALYALHKVYSFVVGVSSDLADIGKFQASHGLYSKIKTNCNRGSGGCFNVRTDNQDCDPPSSLPPSEPHSQAAAKGSVCLGEFRSFQDRLTRHREMVMSRDAYDHDVLFDLVLYSRQLLLEAEQREQYEQSRLNELAKKSKAKPEPEPP